MKLLITGGTGFIGGALCRTLAQRGHTLMILSRQPGRDAFAGATFLPWDAHVWQRAAEGCDGVINLAGESLAAKRWSSQQKSVIRDSRLKATGQLIDAITSWTKKLMVIRR